MRAWLGVVCRSHAQRGIAGGFIQLCHGKLDPLRRMAEGDRLVIYSPRTEMGAGESLQAFTAYGVVGAKEIRQVEMAPGFRPFRRDVAFLPAMDAPIRPLLDRLTLTKDQPSWGMLLRRGQVPLALEDLALIAKAMGVADPAL